MAQPARDRLVVLIGVPLISLAMVFASGNQPWQSVPVFLVSWAVSLVYTLVLGLGNRAIWHRLQRHFPRMDQTKRRLWWLGIGSVLYTSAATVGLTLLLAQLIPGFGRFSWLTLLIGAALNLIPTLVGQLVYESRHFFQQWEENLRRAEQLAQASTQAQLDALQAQLDPHFLFNSLNTLAALIEPTNEDAQRYLENLADVYRYVLLSREHPSVPLAEELAFVETYVALQRVRFRDNLQVRYHVAPAALVRHVAPLSVQLLVENALKHNEASRARPLHLNLTTSADAEELVVANNLQLRPAGLTPSIGTGLANVRRRYALLGAARAVAAGAADGMFTVRLPLLAPARIAASAS